MRQEQDKNIFDDTTAVRHKLPKEPEIMRADYEPSQIIYCDLERLQPDKKKPNDWYRDSDLGGIAIPTKRAKPDGTVEDIKKLVEAVKSSNPFKGGDEARAKVFTLSIPEDEHTNFANQITIAPVVYFLDFLVEHDNAD